jgi:hypothetical protein
VLCFAAEMGFYLEGFLLSHVHEYLYGRYSVPNGLRHSAPSTAQRWCFLCQLSPPLGHP